MLKMVGLLLFVAFVVIVLCSPLIAILFWILRRAKRRQMIDNTVEELLEQAKNAPPEPNRWNDQARARLPLLVAGAPGIMGNSVVCPLIPERMMELLGVAPAQRGDVPGDIINVDALTSGPFADLLDRLGSTSLPAQEQQAFRAKLIEDLIAACEQTNRATRVGVIRSWARDKGYSQT